MSANYQVVMRNPNTLGVDQVFINFVNLDYARKENEIGTMTLQLPYTVWKNYPWQVDSIFEIHRSVEGSAFYLEGLTCWFLRKINIKTVNRKEKNLILTAYDANTLLKRRLIPATNETAAANVNGYADDLAKAFVYNNCGLGAIAARRFPVFTVAANEARGASVNMSMGYRYVLDACKGLADASINLGTYMAFDVVYNPFGQSLVFQTFIGQRGTNRIDSANTGFQVSKFSDVLGSIVDTDTVWDYSAEVNYLYAKSKGEGALTVTQEASNASRVTASPYNRIEGLLSSMASEEPADLIDDMNQELQRLKPLVQVSGKLIDTNQIRYGIDYNFGDYLPIEAEGQRYNIHVKAIHVTVGQGGEEVIDNRFTSV